LIPDIKKFLPVAIFKMSTTIPHKFNIVRFQRSPFLKWPPQFRTNSTLFDFNVLNWFLTLKISTGLHFQIVRHNTTKIQGSF
jgi:hypothetical protein